MLGYVETNGKALDGVEVRDVLDEITQDIHGAALILMGTATQDFQITPAQLEPVTCVLILIENELRSILQQVEIHVKQRCEGAAE